MVAMRLVLFVLLCGFSFQMVDVGWLWLFGLVVGLLFLNVGLYCLSLLRI